MARNNELQSSELKAVATQPIAVTNSWSRWEPETATYQQLAINGPARNSAIAGAFLQFGIRFPEPKLKAYKEDKEIEHIALQAIRDNIVMDESALMLYTIHYVLLGGNCYWLKVKGAKGQPVGIFPYSDAYVTPVPTETGLLSHYAIKDKNGVKHRFEPEDIVHLKWFSVDPRNHLKAQSPTAQLANDAETDNLLTQSINSILKNDATPRSAYILDPEAGKMLSASEGGLSALIDKIKSKYKEAFGGKNKGDVGVFVGGKIERLAMGFHELETEAIRSIPESRIAAVLGIPPILIGLSIGLDSATYSNYGQARLAFVQDTLMPIWVQWASAITRGLVKETGVEIRFDTDKVGALQEAKAAHEDRVIMLVEKNLLTKKEGREKLGLPELSESPHNVLRDSVGGAQALLASQIAYASGQTVREAGIANAMLLYDFDKSDAEALFPIKQAPAFEAQQQESNSPQTPVEEEVTTEEQE